MTTILLSKMSVHSSGTLAKYISFIFLLLFVVVNLHSQASCDEIRRYVQTTDFGITYSSYNSDAITKVYFHQITDESYNTLYFAIVQFKSSYTEYIYQVDSNTQLSYSINYTSSAGEAFWDYIHPYRQVLGCAPDL